MFFFICFWDQWGGGMGAYFVPTYLGLPYWAFSQAFLIPYIYKKKSFLACFFSPMGFVRILSDTECLYCTYKLAQYIYSSSKFGIYVAEKKIINWSERYFILCVLFWDTNKIPCFITPGLVIETRSTPELFKLPMRS